MQFEAVLNNREVYFYWTTESEQAADMFYIECSVDGKNFDEVIAIPAAGNSSIPLEYFDVDNTPSAGQSFYRLKITDMQGNASYTASIPVQNTGEQLRINIETTGENCLPARDTSEKVLLVLRDNAGQEFYSMFHLFKTNEELIGCDVEQRVPSGIYLVTAASRHVYYASRIVVE